MHVFEQRGEPAKIFWNWTVYTLALYFIQSERQEFWELNNIKDL